MPTRFVEALPPRMKHHRATFQLLGRDLHVSEKATAIVLETEERLGFPLPSSIREWYGYDEALQILDDHSNGDPPIQFRDFHVVEWQGHRMLPIRHENQGVCTWAVLLDGSEDPPVYVDVDSAGQEWRLQAASFSTYVYSCVWDYRQVFGRPALVQAQNGRLGLSALDQLRVNFDAELVTHGWPGNAQYRFSSDKTAVLIWDSENQADWFIAGEDGTTLEAAINSVWDIDDVGSSLYECSEIGKAVLAKLGKKT